MVDPFCLLAALSLGQSAALPALPLASPLSPVEDHCAFRTAVARALAQSPSAALAASELRRARALVEEARAASLPTLSATGEYARVGPNSLATGITSSSGQALVALDNWLLLGNAAVPLLAPLAWSQWAHAENDLAAARWTEREARRQLALSAAHAYLTVIAEKRIVASNQRACDTDRVHHEYTAARLAAGEGSPLDEMRARQQYQSDLAQLDGALLDLERAQQTLGVLLGVVHPVDSEDEPALEAPAVEVRAEERWRARPDLQEGEARIVSARQVVRDAWLDELPSLSFNFEPSFQRPALAPGTPLTWEFLLTLSWTLYDGGLRYGLHKERNERLLQAQLSLDSRSLDAAADVQNGWRATTRTAEALEAARGAASAAHQAVAVASQQYQAGATTNIGVVDAERRAHDADTAVAVAEDALRQARLDLLGALGQFP